MLCILLVFTACKAQHTELQKKYSNITKSTVVQSDTVTSLSNNIMVVFQDSKHDYWFGSWVDGLYRFDGKTLLHISKLNGIGIKRVDEIKEDSNGNLYVKTNKGIFKINQNTSEQLHESLHNDSHWHRTNGDIFFKNTQGSSHVYRYDGRFLHKLTFPNVTINGTLIQSSFTDKTQLVDPYGVYTIYTDSKGHLWFGTAVVGVCYFDGSTLRWIHEKDVTELHKGPSNGVRSILEDNDGYFWFNSLYKYKINNSNTPNNSDWYERLKSIGSLDGKINGEMYEYLTSLNDNNNVIWIATYVNGIWEYKGTTIKNHLIKSNNKTINLYSLYSDKTGKLWVGTHENGVYTYNGTTFIPFIP